MNDAIAFEVTTDLTVINPQKIETNFEAVKDWLSNALQPYTGMVVTADRDSLVSAKQDRAAIRKMVDAIAQQRKAVKEQWDKPLREFEAQCKELEGMGKETAEAIDVQVKEIEQREKDEKLATIKAEFDSMTADIAAYVKWDKLLNPKWVNKGYRLEDALQEVRDYADLIRADLEAVRSLNSPDEAVLLLQYAQTHDIREVLRYGKALEDTRAAEERRRAAEVDNSFAETKKPVERIVEPVVPIQSVIRPCVDEEKPVEKLYTLRFSVDVTAAQANKLKAFFAENGIKYKKI